MVVPSGFFHIERVNTNIYALRERLDLIDPIFLTKYVNAYLYLATETAVLIDTGNGIIDYHAAVQPLIGERDLLVFNTHNHFDHVGGNRFFTETYLHKLDVKALATGSNMQFLQSDVDHWYNSFYEPFNYVLPISPKLNIVQGGEIYNLGNHNIVVHFTPGHSHGSICLQIDNVIFTGDTFHKGAVYLPELHDMETYIASLRELQAIGGDTFYTGHETMQLTPEDLEQFITNVEHILDSFSQPRPFNEKLAANIATMNGYLFVIPANTE